nr:sterol carrier protein domain-containing protein [Ligilactobacillus apodemi]
MSRIIDIEQLFTHILLDQAKIVLEVTEDEQCPWNIGSWQLEQGTCKKVDQPGELKASIQSWSELLLGDLTLAEGLFLGKVTATKKFETEIFPKGQQRFYDYF